MNTTLSSSAWKILAICAITLSSVGLSAVHAQGFSALVSPPRFEDNVKPGDTYRNIIEITNVSNQKSHFSARTADWSLNDAGAAEFFDPLSPNSCRPWVAVESHDITAGPNVKTRYRFEVKIPANAPAGECRFAILIEGDPENIPGSKVPLPVSGRIGVIVYLVIGNATSNPKLLGYATKTIDNRLLPGLKISNSGNAHGRLEGLVDGTDASGKTYSMIPANTPILPGETRVITLTPQPYKASDPAPVLHYPVRLSGRLDFGSKHIDVKDTVSQ